MYNVVIGTKYLKDGQENTRWIKVGEAYNGNSGITLRLDSPIIHNAGDSTWLNLFLKEGKTENGISKKNE